MKNIGTNHKPNNLKLQLNKKQNKKAIFNEQPTLKLDNWNVDFDLVNCQKKYIKKGPESTLPLQIIYCPPPYPPYYTMYYIKIYIATYCI